MICEYCIFFCHMYILVIRGPIQYKYLTYQYSNSHYKDIFTMGIPIWVSWCLCIESVPSVLKYHGNITFLPYKVHWPSYQLPFLGFYFYTLFDLVQGINAVSLWPWSHITFLCNQIYTIYRATWENMNYLYFCPDLQLSHWGRVPHICISKLNHHWFRNVLLPDRRQAIVWTNAGILFIGPSGTNFSEIFIKIHTFSFMKIHLKMLSWK